MNSLDQQAALNWFAQFGVVESHFAQVLAAATTYGADDADLYFEHATSVSVSLSDEKVNAAYTSVDLGLGVRVVVGDQVGYAYTEDLSLESMIRAAQSAAQIAKGGKLHAPVKTSVLQLPDYYPINRHWSDVAISERVPMVRKWEQAAFARDARIKRVQASIADAEKRVLIVSADGRMAADYRPMTRAMVSCTAEDKGVRETNYYNIASRAGLDWYSDERQDRLVHEAVSRSIWALDAGTPPQAR